MRDDDQRGSMYYSEFVKVKKVESILEKLAYISVGFDALVAFATLLVMHSSSKAFSSLLFISDFLIFTEVAVAAVIVVLLIMLKYYKKMLESISKSIFKIKHGK
ncbi:MAG: hypothetical protein ACP5K5_01600 [Candidatus Micrarchaeia archaeon]